MTTLENLEISYIKIGRMIVFLTFNLTFLLINII